MPFSLRKFATLGSRQRQDLFAGSRVSGATACADANVGLGGRAAAVDGTLCLGLAFLIRRDRRPKQTFCREGAIRGGS